jgi:hypothetical protein
VDQNHFMSNYSNSKKITVYRLRRWGFFSHAPQGIITWDEDGVWSKSSNLIQGKMAIKVQIDKLIMEVGYVVEQGNGERKKFYFPVYLSRQPCYFGGFRFFMICPLVCNGFPCKRRTSVLYKPDDSFYLGCRACHRIRYPGQLLGSKYRNNTNFIAMLLDNKISDLEDRVARKQYAGKITKKQQRLNKLYKKVGFKESIYG